MVFTTMLFFFASSAASSSFTARILIRRFVAANEDHLQCVLVRTPLLFINGGFGDAGDEFGCRRRS